MRRLLSIFILKIIGCVVDFLEGRSENEDAEWSAHFVETGFRRNGTEKY